MQTERQQAIAVAKEAGSLVRDSFGQLLRVERKGEVDLVTEADRAAETLIVKRLSEAFPKDDILAEEGSGYRRGAQRCWVVDPLDGTTNFAHGFPWFAVSVALVEEGEPVLGVIYQPLLDELFVAQRGQGAYLNDTPISVTATQGMSDAFLATGFPYDRRQSSIDNLDHFSRMQKTAFACRRAGSACLDLAYVAAGRFDGYWEMKLKPWDVAAGVLLVTEAGGRVSDFAGQEFRLEGMEVLATNGHIHVPLSETLLQGRRP